jgi:micrococcal nuclease
MDSSINIRHLGVGLLAVLSVFALVTCGGKNAIPDGPFEAKVKRVVDGDTIVVSVNGNTERVRYIGVDTPESVKPNTPVQCYAKAASHLNEELVGGKTVILTPGTEQRDRYGRLLAYVRTKEGLDVNMAMISRGAARTLEIAPNTERAYEFSVLESKARNEQAGLWGVCASAQN